MILPVIILDLPHATNSPKAELNAFPMPLFSIGIIDYLANTLLLVTLRHSFIAIVLVFGGCIALMPHAARAQTADSTKTKKKITKLEEVPLKESEARHKPGDTVAIINGELVTFADFNSIMSGYLQSIVKRTKNDVVNDSLYTEVVDSAWDRAITDIIIEHEIVKRRLGMTVAAIKDSLVSDPPTFIRLQFTDSLRTFHPELMRKALNDPRNDTIVSMVVEAERVLLETDRLMASIAKKARPRKNANLPTLDGSNERNTPQLSTTAEHASDFIDTFPLAYTA